MTTLPAWEPRRIRVGGWTVTALTDGFMRLDGGAMWGVVPANLWRPLTPPADDNTIALALRPFLAERDGARVLIEVGVGDRWSPKERAIYHIEAPVCLVDALARVGVDPASVTHVVASHCHWDHIGAQVRGVDGELLPTFPNARHFAPAVEIERAKRPGHARSGSYRADDVAVVERAGLLEPFEGSRELLPGLEVHVLGGHSDGVSVITLRGEGDDVAVFWSDVVPTRHHVQPPYIMAFDIDVVRSFEVRSEWLARAADGRWIGLFYHDLEEPFGRLVREGRRYAFEPLAAGEVEVL